MPDDTTYYALPDTYDAGDGMNPQGMDIMDFLKQVLRGGGVMPPSPYASAGGGVVPDPAQPQFPNVPSIFTPGGAAPVDPGMSAGPQGANPQGSPQGLDALRGMMQGLPPGSATLSGSPSPARPLPPPRTCPRRLLPCRR